MEGNDQWLEHAMIITFFYRNMMSSRLIWEGVETKSGGKKEKVRVNLLLELKRAVRVFILLVIYWITSLDTKRKRKEDASGKKKILQRRERKRGWWWVSVVIITFSPFLFTFFSFLLFFYSMLFLTISRILSFQSKNKKTAPVLFRLYLDWFFSWVD